MRKEEKELRKNLYYEFMRLIDEANSREGNIYYMYRKPVWKRKSLLMTVICFFAYKTGEIVNRIKSIFY